MTPSSVDEVLAACALLEAWSPGADLEPVAAACEALDGPRPSAKRPERLAALLRLSGASARVLAAVVRGDPDPATEAQADRLRAATARLMGA